MRRHSWGGVIFFLILIFIFAGVVWKEQVVAFINHGTNWNLCALAEETRTENALLKDRLAALGKEITLPLESAVLVNIFSSYPFNNQNLFTVDAGGDRGVRDLMPATIDGRILVGQVTKSFNTYSTVRTIFSPDWQVSVRIGAQKIPGLLIGGPTIRVMMIANDKKIEVGDSVISASKELPYGLLIGSIDSVRVDTAAGIFQEATLNVHYVLNDLTELTVLTWTPD